MKKYTLHNIERKVTICICDTKEDAQRMLEIFGSKSNRTIIEEIEYINSESVKFLSYLAKEREQ